MCVRERGVCEREDMCERVCKRKGGVCVQECVCESLCEREGMCVLYVIIY